MGSKTRQFEKVSEAIRRAISAGEIKPGDRVPSIQALAERHGVAYMTARRAVQELVEQGLLESRVGAGSFVCRVDRKAVKVAFVFHRHFNRPIMSHALFGRRCDGFTRAAEERGWTATILAHDWSVDPKKNEVAADDICRKGFDGIVLDEARAHQTHLVSLLKDRMPMVLIDPPYNLEPVDTVLQDEVDHMQLLIDHLLAQDVGHVAFCLDDDYARRPRGWSREHGFLCAVRNRGCSHEVIWGTPEQCAEQIAAGLERIDAVIFFSDPLAGQVRDALRNHGVEIPRDLLAAGHDDYEKNGVGEAFWTTIDPDFEGMGAGALELLARRILGEAPGRPVRLYHPGRLVTRHSSIRDMKGDTPGKGSASAAQVPQAAS